MFSHSHHNKIYTLLQSLKPDIFQETSSYFGGGTLITLINGEYRCSKDVDFICPVGPGYKKLRQIVSDAKFKADIFFEDGHCFRFPRDIKADQYGIRFAVFVDEEPIKFEIVAEARIKLEDPEYLSWLSIPSLTVIDQFAEKLLANSDRWYDASIESRDLIDLSIMRTKTSLPQESIEKAESAYPVQEELKSSIIKFQGDTDYRLKCFKALQIENRKNVIDGLDLLAEDYNISPTARLSDET